MGKKSSRFKVKRFIKEESSDFQIDSVRFLERHGFVETPNGFTHNGKSYPYDRALIEAHNEIALYTHEMLSENPYFVYQEPSDQQNGCGEKAQWEDEWRNELVDYPFKSSTCAAGVIVPNYSRGHSLRDKWYCFYHETRDGYHFPRYLSPTGWKRFTYYYDSIESAEHDFQKFNQTRVLVSDRELSDELTHRADYEEMFYESAWSDLDQEEVLAWVGS